MTTFWAVDRQFDDSSGWVMVGGMQGPQRLHVDLEGPNPDPRHPEPEPDGEPPIGAPGGATLTLPGGAARTSRRYPMYVLALDLPDGERLASHGGGTGWSGRRRDGAYPPSVMNVLFDIPAEDVTSMTATLYDDDDLVAT